MPDLLERRKQNLLNQFEALPDELKNWQELSKEGGQYEKHHSQIDALSKQMLALNAKVKSEWQESKEANQFEVVKRAQMRCAAVQTVWNFFREKFLLRFDLHLGSYLKAADAYAWACYEPVLIDRRKKNPGQPFREPPLVTFHSEVSPWTLSRQSRYEVEHDGTGTSREEIFERVYQALPIPILGIPWQSAQFLPSLAVLAHETGHIVESDFAMETGVSTAVADAVKTSTLVDGWSKYWRKEIFADLFACYTAGPSFVWALADSLPESPAVVASRKRPSGLGDDKWGKYPPATLRMLMNTRALRECGFSTEADAIDLYWTSDYTAHAMQAFEVDLEPVVRAVYAAAALPPDLRYDKIAANESRARKIVIDRNEALPEKESFDPRALVGVAGMVQRQALAAEVKTMAWERLRDHIVKSRLPGVLDRQRDRASHFKSFKTDELHDLIFADLGDPPEENEPN